MSLNKLCSSQSGFVEPLQVFNRLGYFHHHLEVCSLCMPPTFFSSCCSSNILLDICITNFMNSLSESSKNKPPLRKIWFANVVTLVKMYSPNIYKHSRDAWRTTILHEQSTGFTAVKTCIAIRYRCSTGFAVVKMYLLNIYNLSTGSAVVKSA